ncbi:MAG: helix-turn-helix domain-containing protein [Candidatus Krumholzibacteriaceae bacterium]
MNEERDERDDPSGAAPEETAADASGATPPERSIEGAAPAEARPGQEQAAADVSAFLKGEETVGEILVAARERMGQTLEFMSQETKIPKQMLQYLETDNYEALPAKVYSKSFLRTYALALDLDVQYILNKYEVQTGQTHRSKGDHWEIETEVVEEKLRSPNALARYVIPAVIIVLLVILIVKFAGRRENKASPPEQVDLRQELLEKPAAQTAPVQQKTEPAAARPAVEPMELSIAANPTDSCWFELVTISVVEQQPETTINSFTLPPGRSRTFEATEEFFFKKVGNAGGFVMELDGSKLPTLGKKGRVITNYRITRDNLPKAKKE